MKRDVERMKKETVAMTRGDWRLKSSFSLSIHHGDGVKTKLSV